MALMARRTPSYNEQPSVLNIFEVLSFEEIN